MKSPALISRYSLIAPSGSNHAIVIMGVLLSGKHKVLAKGVEPTLPLAEIWARVTLRLMDFSPHFIAADSQQRKRLSGLAA